ncbi:hypothetical protein [Sutcliffiella horikoshii]|uniref:hypothetical protein n=1 Tax=Sutcliffiella horikoshii TaxID=79883 RepID=UPI001F17BBA9|nr:hypothetical protein [Sutcliffiella horikoshii]MCG1023464.1 hypothetical protein [Sutcliffiella horikoshii]
MLYELEVIDMVCDELEKQGYIIVSRKNQPIHNGKDIIAKKVESGVNRMVYIEAIGETSSFSNTKRYGKPFDRSQVKIHLSELLFAVAEILSMKKIENFHYKVGIAIPDNKDHREYISNIQGFLDLAGIAVFFVKKEGVTKIDNGRWDW